MHHITDKPKNEQVLEIAKYSIFMFEGILNQAFDKIITQFKAMNNTISEIISLTININIVVAEIFV